MTTLGTTSTTFNPTFGDDDDNEKLRKLSEWVNKAHTGLVPKKVKVRRGGKEFERMQWVRPEELEDADMVKLNDKFVQKKEKWHKLAGLYAQMMLIHKEFPSKRNKDLIEKIRERINQARNDQQAYKKLIDQLEKRDKEKDKKQQEEEKVDTSNYDAEETKVSSSPVEKSEYLGGGCNVTAKLRFADGTHGVWKPLSGEDRRLRVGTIPEGTFYKREAAAFKLNKLLEFDLCPATVIRNYDGEIGSVQRFAEDADYGHAYKCRKRDIEDCALYDILMGNTDRHRRNFLVTDEGNKLVAIDHGLCFPVKQDYLNSVFYRLKKEKPIPERLMVKLKKLKEEKKYKEEFKKYLESKAIKMFEDRLDDLLDKGSFYYRGGDS